MTRNLRVTAGTWTLPPGFQRTYWSVDFSGLQWQSASEQWRRAEGLQPAYLMKRSCTNANHINKARGQLATGAAGLHNGASHLLAAGPLVANMISQLCKVTKCHHTLVKQNSEWSGSMWAYLLTPVYLVSANMQIKIPVLVSACTFYISVFHLGLYSSLIWLMREFKYYHIVHLYLLWLPSVSDNYSSIYYDPGD